MIEIFKEFTFDAAHHLANNVPADHPYARMHGHSFKVIVYIRGSLDASKAWVMNIETVEKELKTVHAALDHRCLNEIKGLEIPTLENLCIWIWDNLKPNLPLISRVTVLRGTLGEGCTYEG